MWKAKIGVVLFFTLLLSFVQAELLSAAGQVVDVSTAAELRAALEDDKGASVRLVADIVFSQADAADRDYGVMLGGGYYVVDLNGHRLEYNFVNDGGYPSGTPLFARGSKKLVVNGPGTITGGGFAIEQCDQFGVLVVNGGTLHGAINSGIRITGGIAYLNGGTLTGNFYGVFHEDGIIVLGGAKVQSVVHRQLGPAPRQYGLVENGVFTGNTVLEDILLMVPDLTISPGSSVKVIRGGGLIVPGSFVNDGSYAYESGLQSLGGAAMVKGDFQVCVSEDVEFTSLRVENRARLHLENEATVRVTGSFVTEQDTGVTAEDGILLLLGSIDHHGYASGVPELAMSGEHGPEPREFSAQTDAAHRLRALGLFQGVGTHPDGSANFELARAPSRVEALVMLIRLLGKEGEALSGSWAHPFLDVPQWANGYVGYAFCKGLTKGISSTEFGTDTASIQMYLTFVLRALGYSDAEGADFTWDAPENLAQGTGILPDTVHHDDFLRADVVLVSEAALSATQKGTSETLLQRLVREGAVILP